MFSFSKTSKIQTLFKKPRGTIKINSTGIISFSVATQLNLPKSDCDLNVPLAERPGQSRHRERNNNIYQLPSWKFPSRPFSLREDFFPSLPPRQGQGSASLIVFSLNGHIAINKWLNFASQGNGKIPPGWAAWGCMDTFLLRGLSSTLKTRAEIQVHHSQMLLEDQISQVCA